MMFFSRKRLLAVIIVSFFSAWTFPTPDVNANLYSVDKDIQQELEQEVRDFIFLVFKERAAALTKGKIERLDRFYVKNSQTSKYALWMENNRTTYINKWAAMRSIQLVKADSEIRIVRLSASPSSAKVSLVQSMKITYRYLGKNLPLQSFGVGTQHSIALRKTDGEWKIAKEWYLDPFDENPNKIAKSHDGYPPAVSNQQRLTDGPNYKRSRAVAYADKYAGTAWGAGNKHRYNQKYADYTGRGGDCTNFASQVIGDSEEGGGLPMRGAWRYFYKKGGSEAWIRTDSFYNFMLYSGYGKLLGSGTFNEIMSPTRKYADGPIYHLQPGDLIGYIINNNDIDHFSIVTGFDAYGYPLVNSHSADRYRVPFDLGWDQHTRYVLIHVND